MATAQQNRDFADEMLVQYPLDQAIEWIKANLSPGDVFDEEQLTEHTRNNVEIDDVYSERNILDFVRGTYNPAEVFGTGELEGWAEGEGYAKE
jgi:hypothetical protein